MNTLLTEKISKLYILYVIPSVIAMILGGIQGVVDGIFIGNYAGVNAMASINIAIPYYQIIIGCTMVICTGTISAVGRTLGAGRTECAKDIFRSSVITIGMSAVLLLIVGVFFARGIAAVLGANDVLADNTYKYIRMMAIFAPVISYKFFFGYMTRLTGRPNLYLVSTIAEVIINMILNYVFIKILTLGVTGAGAATGLAYVVGLCIVIGPFLSKDTVLNIYDGTFRLKEELSALANGASEGVMYVANALALFLFNFYFMKYAGESGVAAFAVISYIANFVTLLMFGISDGISPIISNNYGAGMKERIQKTKAIALGLNLFVGVITFLIMLLQSEPIIRAFVSGGSQVLVLTSEGAKLYGISFLFCGYNIVQSGYHTAVGHVADSIIIAMQRGIFFIAVGIFFLPCIWGLNGVWIAMPFAEGLTAIWCRFRINKKY